MSDKDNERKVQEELRRQQEAIRKEELRQIEKQREQQANLDKTPPKKGMGSGDRPDRS